MVSGIPNQALKHANDESNIQNDHIDE